jgi:hypothetical protein
MFINHLYQKKKSKSLDILKQLRELFFAVFNNNLTKKSGTVWIYPEFPSRNSTIYKISRRLKFNLVTQPFPNTELGIHFHDATINSPLEQNHPFPIINKEIYDISKIKIDEVHLEIFGYNTIVNPLTHIGSCVVKSNENALHDGQIIRCPIQQTEKNKIYQIIIDNQEQELFVDYRICVMKSDIVIAYKKYKTRELRFTNDTCAASILDIQFIPEIIQNYIVSFTKKMQSDFCEIDVLKDNNTGKWYIIDLNKTPYGPPASLSKSDKKKAVEILSNGFSKNFMN